MSRKRSVVPGGGEAEQKKENRHKKSDKATLWPVPQEKIWKTLTG
jgi:hypothetical protein